MAISITSTTNITAGSGPFTASIDGGSGSGRTFVYVAFGDTSDNMSTVTWNGEAFTKLGSYNVGGAFGRFAYIWYLIPVGTGSQTFTMSGPSDVGNSRVLLYGGAGTPINYVHTTAASTGTSSSLSASPTPASTSWLVGMGGNASANIVAGTNTTLRGNNASVNGADSNGVSSPTALAFTWGGSNTDYFIQLCELPVAAVAANGGFLAFM